MTTVLLDTHTWAWAILDDRKLGSSAKAAMQRASTRLVSPVSVFEIGQKVRLGKWKQMDELLPELPALIEKSGTASASLTPEICLAAATLDWAHRDPFDRILAATAAHYGAALISADVAFDSLPKGTLKRVW